MEAVVKKHLPDVESLLPPPRSAPLYEHHAEGKSCSEFSSSDCHQCPYFLAWIDTAGWANMPGMMFDTYLTALGPVTLAGPPIIKSVPAVGSDG